MFGDLLLQGFAETVTSTTILLEALWKSGALCRRQALKDYIRKLLWGALGVQNAIQALNLYHLLASMIVP